MNKPKMIRVDLTKEKIETLPLREDLTRDYIGGEGIGSRLLWEMVKPHTEPYAPDNAIIFATAPLNGTIFPAGPRGSIVFKSPETGTISMSNIGGHWAAQLKFAGYDLIAVTGKAKRPVYLWIDDETIEIQMTIEDSKALTAPWIVTKTYRRLPEGTKAYDYACAENNRNPVNPETGQTFTLDADGQILDRIID